MLDYYQEQKIRVLDGSDLAREPRSAEEIEYWFSVGPKRKKWKAAETKEWRVELAIWGVPENRALFLQPFIDKKPSGVAFNSAHVAAVLGTKEAFDLAKKRKDDVAQVWQHRTCLSIAAQLGHLEFVKLLLEEGCPYEATKGNDGRRRSPLMGAVAGRHNDVVEILKEHAIPEDLAEAIRVGNLDALALLKKHADLPDIFVCADETTALAVLENFPDVSPENLACSTPCGADLAKAIVAKHPALNAAQVVRHLGRMSFEGVKVLFAACADLGKQFTQIGKKTTLANEAMSDGRVDVLRELMERGFKPSGIKQAIDRGFLREDMQIFLLALNGGPQSTEEFLTRPYADGFKGRFEDPIFGVELGKKLDASNKRLKKLLNFYIEAGVVEGFELSSYMIPGDAWDVISAELDKRFSSRAVDRDRYRSWSGDGVNVKLVKNTDESGTKLTLTVTRGGRDVRATEEITEELLQELTRQFTSTFSELEQVHVEHKDGEITFSGNVIGSEAGVVLTWPTSPLVDGGLERAFVDAVLSDLRESEGSGEDEDD